MKRKLAIVFLSTFAIAFTIFQLMWQNSIINLELDVNNLRALSLHQFRNDSPIINHGFQTKQKSAPSCHPVQPDDIKFTLVIQLSDDRLWMMLHHCRRWKDGLISLVVYTNRTRDSILLDLEQMNCTIQTYFTFEDEDVGALLQIWPNEGEESDDNNGDYPVNALRNMALSVVRTTHVMFIDADFWSSESLQEDLMSTNVKEALALDPKLGIVVPAFQLEYICPDKPSSGCRKRNLDAMPLNFDTFIELMYSRRINIFDRWNEGGHGTTNYPKWLLQSGSHKNILIDIPCLKSQRYEPYLAIRYCDTLPPFQEQFSGYGKNKLTWAMHLWRVGFVVKQLGNSFLLHYPHDASSSRLQWNQGPEEFAEARRKKRTKKPEQQKKKEGNNRRRLRKKKKKVTIFCYRKI